MQDQELAEDIDLNWLLKLRWAALLGQCTLVATASQLLHLKLPLGPIIGLIAFFATSNVLLHWTVRARRRFTSPKVAGILLFDTSILASLLYWSGGSMNPFSTLFLVHITLAAVLLGPLWTWILAIYSSLCFVALFTFYIPLDSMVHSHGSEHQMSLHLEGMLIAFIITAALIAYFLDKVSKQLRQLQHQRSKQKRLASLAALAAGAAHELGSPLAAIAIANGELGHALERGELDEELCSDNVSLIRDAVARCKKIIDHMGGKMIESKDSLPDTVDFSALAEALGAQLPLEKRDRLSISLPQDVQSIVAPREMLLSALREMLKNAFDASDTSGSVHLEIRSKNNATFFYVEDRGHGIADADLPHVVEPFFSTKDPGKGMGLGCFIVDLCARSMEGEFSITALPGKGTSALLKIPNKAAPQGRKQHAG